MQGGGSFTNECHHSSRAVCLYELCRPAVRRGRQRDCPAHLNRGGKLVVRGHRCYDVTWSTTSRSAGRTPDSVARATPAGSRRSRIRPRWLSSKGEEWIDESSKYSINYYYLNSIYQSEHVFRKEFFPFNVLFYGQ